MFRQILITGLVIIILMIMWIDLRGSGLLLPWSARSAATNCMGLLSREPGNIHGNPSLGSSGLSVGSSMLYNMEELTRTNLAIGKEIGKMYFGYGIMHLNHPYWQESDMSVNICYRFGQLRFGVNLRSLVVEIDQSSLINSWQLDTGIYWRNRQFESSLAWLNLTQSKLEQEKLPVYICWESSWLFYSESRIAIRLEKEDDFEFQSTIGGSHQVCKQFELLASYTHKPEIAGCGFSINIKEFRLSYAIQYHLELMETHYINLSYALSD